MVVEDSYQFSAHLNKIRPPPKPVEGLLSKITIRKKVAPVFFHSGRAESLNFEDSATKTFSSEAPEHLGEGKNRLGYQ